MQGASGPAGWITRTNACRSQDHPSWAPGKLLAWWFTSCICSNPRSAALSSLSREFVLRQVPVLIVLNYYYYSTTTIIVLLFLVLNYYYYISSTFHILGTSRTLLAQDKLRKNMSVHVLIQNQRVKPRKKSVWDARNLIGGTLDPPTAMF